MNRISFEPHLLGADPIPFIFHTDTGSRNNWHLNVELLYCLEGATQVICAHMPFPFEAGDLFVVNANTPHIILPAKGLKYHCLIADSTYCRQNGIDTDALRFKNRIQDAYAAKLYEQISEAFSCNRRFQGTEIKIAVLSLLLYLARHYTENELNVQNAYAASNEAVQLSIGYIQAHFTEKLTIDQLAKEAGLSKYYFVRRFKKLTGDTVIAFIHKLRCENAKKLLLSECFTVQEISEKTGFEDVSYFGKVFKKYVGCSPSAYIKKCAEAHLLS